ncbi:Non-specific serine/threonine protein kinase [Fusarium sp. LHS14.1]|nr:Non-specific serine/threonine protein kinase [Fusarium sp. LHS14.1]
MTGQPRSNAIEENAIGKGLGAFRSPFTTISAGRDMSSSSDALGQLSHEDLRNLTLLLLPSLQSLPVAGLLDSKSGRGTLRSDILKLISAAASADVDFDFDRVKPLLISALANEPDDTLIWDQVYDAD